MADKSSLELSLRENGQEHLLQFWDKLDSQGRSSLTSDLEGLDLPRINRYFMESTATLDSTANGECVDSHLEPIPADMIGSASRMDADSLKAYYDDGCRQISDGRVAVLLMAGGQGTRLGVSYPKGMYNVGLPSAKTLYQLQAERILKLQQLATAQCGEGNAVIPWYIMTSEHTKEPSEAFFRRHDYFGLRSENVVFFEQHTLPCLTLDGRIILQQRDRIARAPDGNGGLYRALGDEKVMGDLEKRGIKYVHVYCVDNILVKMADPVFLGFCREKNAAVGVKVVEKAFPTEAVGVVCKVSGVYQVVEYSEIRPETAQRRNADGGLTFNAGNICNHLFTMDFLKMVVREKESEMVHHVAKKKIPYVNEAGEIVKPTQPNGIKMEKFVFDVFQFCRDFAAWEVPRGDEFSPLKNADGAAKDTPTTARNHLYNLHRRWVKAAGGDLRPGDDDSDVICEISPLLSYAGEGLESSVNGKRLQSPLSLNLAKDTNQMSCENGNT